MTCWYRPVPQGGEVEDPGAGTQDLEEEHLFIEEGGGGTEEGEEQTTGGAAGSGIYSTHYGGLKCLMLTEFVSDMYTIS